VLEKFADTVGSPKRRSRWVVGGGWPSLNDNNPSKVMPNASSSSSSFIFITE